MVSAFMIPYVKVGMLKTLVEDQPKQALEGNLLLQGDGKNKEKRPPNNRGSLSHSKKVQPRNENRSLDTMTCVD